MSYKKEVADFISDLARISQSRHEFAEHLSHTASILHQAELEGESTSGKLSLDQEIEDLNLASKNLDHGVFRLLVLGDMKRGKSTLLNALLGEPLLPSAVNPCTAVLTILRFGQQQQVTIHFNDGKQPEQLSFDDFKRRYTIDPKEAKQLEAEKVQAFPDVDYAVVECSLPLLENGVEIVDSPGLNDTEERNELTLGYINNCHAILFVLSATQQCTKEERRYLENYIKGRSLPVFFLINRWDELRGQVVDEFDPPEVQAANLRQAERDVRDVFRANLYEHCQIDGSDLYGERVFEISAKQALSRRINKQSLSGTGFPEFMGSLNSFLTQERAVSEFRQAKTLIRQTYGRVHEAVDRRIPLLSENVDELKRKIRVVQPEFDKLVGIRDRFKDEIRVVRDRKTDEIADFFRSYISNLSETFEVDFSRYQPELKFIDFLRAGKRKEFEASLRQAFGKYLNDKIADWNRTVDQDMSAAFSQLAVSAAQYGQTYSKITDKITASLTGYQDAYDAEATAEDKSPGWTKWAMGLYALTTGDIAAVAMAGTGAFNWKQILLNLFGAALFTAVVSSFTGIFLGPIGMALGGLGLGGISAEMGRKKVLATMKEELRKQLPQVAREQSDSIRKAIKECFDEYSQEVEKRMNDDIRSRKAELDELVKHKEKGEVDQEAEARRLNRLNNDVFSKWQQIETAYEQLLVKT
jgi:GTPase SAR1 family protein